MDRDDFWSVVFAGVIILLVLIPMFALNRARIGARDYARELEIRIERSERAVTEAESLILSMEEIGEVVDRWRERLEAAE